MEIYQTESQQVEALKQFLFKYKKLIGLVIILGLIVIFGFQVLRNHNQKQETKAADLFQAMLVEDGNGELLLKGYSKTPYPQMAALLLAKKAVLEGDLPKAEEQLRWVIAQKKHNKLATHIATERLARVLLQLGKPDEALQLLTKTKPDTAYEALYEEVIGDIYVAKNDNLQAKTAYMKAMVSLPEGAQNPLLQMKLMDLGLTVDEIKALAAGEQNA